MPSNFTHTLRSLEAGGSYFHWRWAFPCLFLSLGVWMGWFVFMRVPVYEVSTQARLEVSGAVHPITAAASGRIVENRLALGTSVHAGEVVAVLELESERLALEEGREQAKALTRKAGALRAEIRAEEEAKEKQSAARLRALTELRAMIQAQRGILPHSEQARNDAQEEACARVAEAEARAKVAELMAESYKVLHAHMASSDNEYRRFQAEAEAARAQHRAITMAAGKLENDRLMDEGDRKARIEALEHEAHTLEELRIVEESDRAARLAHLASQLAVAEGEIEIQGAALKRLEHQASERNIRAPADGRIGDLADLKAGAFVAAGARLGTVVPPGPLRAVGAFSSDAIGRIAPGQPAHVRLNGFPSTQYGSAGARVARVSNEPASGPGGKIRVEFDLDPDATSLAGIELEHGQTGTIEVEVERVSPAVLVLRAAGYFVQRVPGAIPSTGLQP